MKARKISIFVAGIALGTVLCWLAKFFVTPPMDALTETSILKAPGIAVWYKSFEGKKGEFINEFHFRKLCGDEQHACSHWSLAGSTKSERPYPAKDIELNGGGDLYMVQMPDGHTLKGTVDGTWTVETPAK